MTTTKATDELLTKIAVHFFPTCETLETRNSDSLDFHETAVWSIKEALQQAFELGRQTADEPAPVVADAAAGDDDQGFDVEQHMIKAAAAASKVQFYI